MAKCEELSQGLSATVGPMVSCCRRESPVLSFTLSRLVLTVDDQVPKRKPYSEQNPTSVKPPALPKKYVPFSKTDSRAIENTFQKLLTEGNDEARKKLHEKVEMKRRMVELKPDSSLEGGLDAGAKVPVNEDYLFDVDVNERELGPAYWLGPVYDVRRGSWFFAGAL